MKTAFIFLSFFFAVACSKDYDIAKPGPLPAEDYSQHPKNETYGQALKKIRAESNAPGMILLIKKPGETLWIGADGASNLEHQIQMQVSTPFRAASITKTFVAVLVLKMAEAGQLSLSDNLNTYLPEFKDKIPSIEKITIRHLLSHQSGIFDPSNQSQSYQLKLINEPERMRDMPVEELIKEYVFDKALLFDPGSSYSYGNVNYWLLGMIVERITNKSFSQMIHEFIIDPLHLGHTYFNSTPGPEISREYADLGHSGKILDVTRFDEAESSDRASSGLISTAFDLYKFMEALVQGDLISETSLNDLINIQLENCQDPDCEYGLGVTIWRTTAGDAWGNNGTLLGVEANMLYFPGKGDFLVMFRNNGNGSRKELLWELLAD